jgi:MbtH protein
MTNSFENLSATYRLLVNEVGQYSLWPDFIAIPAGWFAAGPEGDRHACIRWINEAWTDMSGGPVRSTPPVNDRSTTL